VFSIPFIHNDRGYKYIAVRESIANGRKIKRIQALGKIPKDEAEKELSLFLQKMEVKPIYRTIVIDPPWPMEKIKRDVAPNQIGFDYKTMTIEEIKEFKTQDFVSDQGCHLYLWTTQKFLPAAFEILNSWGFNYVFTMIWHKNGGFQPFNLPQYNAEFILFGKKGNLNFTTTKQFFCAFRADRNGHSKKPDEFYDMVRRVSPEPRIDIFNRRKIEGFDRFGYEAA
jgi:N6-adenosine-specific RNA methylase IME4